MRLWSLHPSYLDAAGVVALWREALLAQKVLLGETVGYRHHPQLERFRTVDGSIGNYLRTVHDESVRRGYHFDRQKIRICAADDLLLPITKGQLEYEFEHLMAKLRNRTPQKVLEKPVTIDPNPLFYEVEGDICDWEIVKKIF